MSNMNKENQQVNTFFKNFEKELDFDVDTIEEYEEVHTQFSKSNKVRSNPIVVRKAKQEELDRIDRILAKRHENVNPLVQAINYIETGYDSLEDYLDVKETIEEEYTKRYKPTKTKVCRDVSSDDFEDMMIYTKRYVFKTDNHQSNVKFIDTINYLNKNYAPHEYVIQNDKVHKTNTIYILEENTLDKNLKSYSSNQLQDYQDKLNTLLNSSVDKIVLTGRLLRNTFITHDSFENVLLESFPIYSTLKEYYLAVC